jgi:hypothetical protein
MSPCSRGVTKFVATMGILLELGLLHAARSNRSPSNSSSWVHFNPDEFSYSHFLEQVKPFKSAKRCQRLPEHFFCQPRHWLCTAALADRSMVYVAPNRGTCLRPNLRLPDGSVGLCTIFKTHQRRPCALRNKTHTFAGLPLGAGGGQWSRRWLLLTCLPKPGS